jgi:predicted dehydrogenase
VHHPGLQLAGLCDIRPAALAAGVQRSGGRPATFADFEQMLSDLPLDIVVISTPNHLHAPMSIAASGRGCHVLCEKPMATTVSDCQAMVHAAAKAQRVLLIGMQRRYSPVYNRAYQLVQDGTIGRPRFMNHVEYRGDWAKKSKDPEEDRRINWRYRQQLSGGTLLEKSTHFFDVFAWFSGGRGRQVSGVGGINVYSHRDTLDHAAVSIGYSGDIAASHTLSLYGTGHMRFFDVLGDQGRLRVYYDSSRLELHDRQHRREPLVVQAEGHSTWRTVKRHSGTPEMYDALVSAVRQGATVSANGLAGLEAVRVAVAGEQAIRTGQVVQI